MPKIKIPGKLLLLNPSFTEKELRLIIYSILKAKTKKLLSSHIVDFKIPALGRFKSHGGKKVKRYQKYLRKDRKKKKLKYEKILMSKEKLLW